jgi:hypothetical protein
MSKSGSPDDARNYYEILQVRPDADPEVIEEVYHRLADKYRGEAPVNPAAAERLAHMDAAFEVLGNAGRRAEYDLALAHESPVPTAPSPAAAAQRESGDIVAEGGMLDVEGRLAYCPNCGAEVEAEARYCGNCSHSLHAGPAGSPSGSTPAVPTLALNDVPAWLGWVAVGAGVLASVLGVGLCSFWAYRRGRREGVPLQPSDPPYEDIGWPTLGWLVAAFVPLLGWYAMVHLPTLWYKNGLRVGARDKGASRAFTSVPGLSVAVLAPWALVIVVAFMVGFVGALNGDDKAATGDLVTTPVFRVEATPAPNFTVADAIRLTQSQVADSHLFPSGTSWIRCTSALYRSGNHLWVVTCEYFVNKEDAAAASSKTYAFDDDTGRVQ